MFELQQIQVSALENILVRMLLFIEKVSFQARGAYTLYDADGWGGFRYCYTVLFMVGGGFDFCADVPQVGTESRWIKWRLVHRVD